MTNTFIILTVVFVLFSLPFWVRASNPAYDNILITPQTWQEVDLVYTSIIKGQSYTNTIQLLRPCKWLKQHHMATIGHVVLLSIPEFGLVNVRVVVTAIKSTYLDMRDIHISRRQASPVVGVFKRYVTDVRTYTFEDVSGKITRINATPTHPFYAINKKGFVPISQVSDADQLVSIENDEDNVMHLVCIQGKHKHCGVPYRHGRAIVVYNLEVYKRHIYCVGHDCLIVHNVCGRVENLDDYGVLVTVKNHPKSTVKIYLTDSSIGPYVARGLEGQVFRSQDGTRAFKLFDDENIDLEEQVERFNHIMNILGYDHYATATVSYFFEDTKVLDMPFIAGEQYGDIPEGELHYRWLVEEILAKLHAKGYPLVRNLGENIMITPQLEAVPIDTSRNDILDQEAYDLYLAGEDW